MQTNDPWKPFHEAVNRPFSFAAAWKARTGGKVIGHLLPDVPEEIIHAAGALPLAIEGSGCTGSLASEHLPGFTCSHAMGAVELSKRGDLELLDGMVIPYVCDTTRNLFHMWNHCFRSMNNEFLRLPKRLDYLPARAYLKDEFSRFFDQVGRWVGTSAQTDRLSAAIALYNRSREQLRRAYACHRADPDVWTAARIGAITGSALRVPRDEHLQWMESLPWNEAPAETNSRVPVYVRGKVWDPPGILDLFDTFGLMVAGDDIVTGFRSTHPDAAVDGDPIRALVDRHFSMTPYAGYHERPQRIVQDLVDRVQASGAQGVLFLNPKFCEAAAFDTPDMEKALKDAGIPYLVLETSAQGVSLERLKLRIEAFREMLDSEID